MRTAEAKVRKLDDGWVELTIGEDVIHWSRWESSTRQLILRPDGDDFRLIVHDYAHKSTPPSWAVVPRPKLNEHEAREAADRMVAAAHGRGSSG